jgi:hypothetical protein
MIKENEKSVRYQLDTKKLGIPKDLDQFHKAKRNLINEVKEKRLKLLSELDVLWLAEQIHEQYQVASKKKDVRGSLAALNLLADKLRLFERAEASKLQVKSETWNSANIEQVQMDLVKYCIETGQVQLAARVLETMKKGRDKTDIEINYEAQLQQLLDDKKK